MTSTTTTTTSSSPPPPPPLTPSLPILYVDEHIIVVDKPFGLNTIPGNALVKDNEQPEIEEETGTPTPIPTADTNNKRKRTHQELWMDMLQGDPTPLHQALASHSTTTTSLTPTLTALLSYKSSIPRKRTKFIDWGTRILKLPASDLDALYDILHATFEAKEGNRQDSVLTRLLQTYKEIKTVHRLDCETSGACVLARTVAAARNLSEQFREKKVEKKYVALLDGAPLPLARGEVCLPIRPEYEIRPKQMMDPVDGKASRTLFRTVAVEDVDVDNEEGNGRGGGGGKTRVELTPLTGRTHQLRVHMAALGFPICGDSIYSKEDAWKGEMAPLYLKEWPREEGEADDNGSGGEQQQTQAEIEHKRLETVGDRLHLHAEVLSFDHPITGERLRFVAKAPF